MRIALSPNGKHIATYSGTSNNNSHDLVLRDLSTGKEIRPFQMSGRGWPSAMVFSPDGKRLLVARAGPHELTLFDVDTGNTLQDFTGHTSEARGLAVSPDGTRVVSGSGVTSIGGGVKTPVDCGVRIWDAATGKEIERIKNFTQGVTCLAVSPDGKTLLVGSFDRSVRVMDMQGKEIRCFTGHTRDITSVAFLPDGNRALSSDRGGAIRLWEVETAKPIRLFGAPQVWNFSLARDGRRFLTCHPDNTVRLWDIENGRELHKHQESGGNVNYTLLSPDGGTAVWATSKKTLVIYGLPRDKP